MPRPYHAFAGDVPFFKMCARGAHSTFIIFYLLSIIYFLLSHHLRRVHILPLLHALQMQVAARVRLGGYAAHLP